MSKPMFGIMVAVCFAIATPLANAGTQCGCGQVAQPLWRLLRCIRSQPVRGVV